MTKQNFLDDLQQMLSGEVSPEVMMDSYRYYSGYFDEEMRTGKTEEQVAEELGMPSMIAKSIIAAQGGDRVVDEEYTENGKTKKVSHKSSASDYGNTEKKEFKFTFNPFSWYAKIIYALIILLLILLVFCIIKGLFWIFVTFGIPILIVLGIIYIVMYFTK